MRKQCVGQSSMQCLHDESVRVEVDETSTPETEPLMYLEEDHEAACQALDRLGYNGDSLRVALRRRSENLLRRLPPEATREEKVKAVVQAGINLSSLFYQVGPTCLSTDMIFQAFEYKELLAKYKLECDSFKRIQKKKECEIKGKMALAKTRLTVKDYECLLRWKIGDEFVSVTKGFKLADYKKIWEDEWRDKLVEDNVLPPEPVAPLVPEPCNTALGRTVTKKFEEALAAGETVLSDDDFKNLAAKLKEAVERKGITID